MFQYYVRTPLKELTSDTVRPLAHVGDLDELRWVATTSGPDERQGLYVSLKTHTFTLQRYSQSDWVPMVPDKSVWVRMHAQPTPDDMVRPGLLDGYAVELADGHRWIIPRALRWQDLQTCAVSLPMYDLYDAVEQRWRSNEILPQYRRLWEVAGQVLQYLDGQTELTAEQEIESVVVAIGTHYRMGATECSIAKMLTVAIRYAVWSAMIDQVGLNELKKKAAAAGLNSADGKPVDSATISQATLTS